MLHEIMSSAMLVIGLKVPLIVIHHITYRCNLSCKMCSLKFLPSVQELTTAACIDLQQDFRKHGTLVWGYSGGEPLVREDLEQLYVSAKHLGMRTVLNTNGVLLPQRLELGRMADVLEIALDGGRESHDALRGDGAFDKAVAGLEAVTRLGPSRPRIIIQTILSNRSIQPDQLDEVLRLASTYDVKIGFTLAASHRVDDRLLDNARIHTPNAQQFRDFRRWLEHEKTGRNGNLIQDDPAFFRSLGHFPDYPNRIPCKAGLRRCVVDPTGLTLPCADQFDHPFKHLPRGKRFGYGYAGFKSLPRAYPCHQQYCYTAKTNFILGNPWRIAEYFFTPSSGCK